MSKLIFLFLLMPLFSFADEDSLDIERLIEDIETPSEETSDENKDVSGKELKTNLNQLQLKMDRLLLKKSQTEDRLELDEVLGKIVKLNRDLVTAKRSYNAYLVDMEKVNPKMAKEVREQDKIVATLRRQAKNAGKGKATVGLEEEVDPLAGKLNSIFQLVKTKYASFMDNETAQLDKAKEEIQLKHFRVKERERKEYLERSSSQKLSQ